MVDSSNHINTAIPQSSQGVTHSRCTRGQTWPFSTPGGLALLPGSAIRTNRTNGILGCRKTDTIALERAGGGCSHSGLSSVGSSTSSRRSMPRVRLRPNWLLWTDSRPPAWCAAMFSGGQMGTGSERSDVPVPFCLGMGTGTCGASSRSRAACCQRIWPHTDSSNIRPRCAGRRPSDESFHCR